MNELRIGSVDFTHSNECDLDEESDEYYSNKVKIPEFFIDGQPLIELLGDYRHLGNSDNDLKCRGILAQRYILQLLGRISEPNQFGSKRIVLYRCHCGCEYCGVFSTEIVIEKQTVQWKLIAWEDECNQTVFEPAINLTFYKNQYFKAIRQYCKGSQDSYLGWSPIIWLHVVVVVTTVVWLIKS